MNLYLIEQDENNGYDTYDAFVVAAKDDDAARNYHPGKWGEKYSTWASDPKHVRVTLIGKAGKGVEVGRILGSFNAG